MNDRELLQFIADKLIVVEQDVSSLKVDMITVKVDLSSLTDEQSFLKQAILEIDAWTISTEEKIFALPDQVSLNTEQLSTISTMQHLVNDHDTDIRIIKKMLIQ